MLRHRKAVCGVQHLRDHLDPLVISGSVPGAVLSCWLNGETSHVAVGALTEGGLVAPDPKTLFEIGSIGKVFTGLLLAEAERNGELLLDARADRTPGLPADARFPTGAEFTLRQLATHSSGLPWVPAEFDLTRPDFFAGFTRRDLWRALARAELGSAPGTTYAYSNFGAGLLGVLLECATGLSYAEQIRRRVAEPMGLCDTVVDASGDRRRRLAPPHQLGLPSFYSTTDDALAAAGCLKSTSVDVLEFARFHLDPPDTPLGASARLATEEHFARAGRDGGVGLGWHILEDGTCWHNGATFGHHAFTAFSRERRLAMALVANDVAPVVTEVGFRVLDDLLGNPRGPIELAPVVVWSPARVLGAMGRYENPERGVVIVLRTEHERIVAQLDGQDPYRVVPVSDRELRYHAVDATLRLGGSDLSRNDVLELHQDGAVLVLTREGEP